MRERWSSCAYMKKRYLGVHPLVLCEDIIVLGRLGVNAWPTRIAANLRAVAAGLCPALYVRFRRGTRQVNAAPITTCHCMDAVKRHHGTVDEGQRASWGARDALHSQAPSGHWQRFAVWCP